MAKAKVVEVKPVKAVVVAKKVDLKAEADVIAEAQAKEQAGKNYPKGSNMKDE